MTVDRTTVALRRMLHPLQPAPDTLSEGLPEWAAHAMCAQTNPDVFFPEKGDSLAEAKRICSLCAVVPECLAWALDVESGTFSSYGVYGGVSAHDRTLMLREKLGLPCTNCGARYRHMGSHYRQSPECRQSAAS